MLKRKVEPELLIQFYSYYNKDLEKILADNGTSFGELNMLTIEDALKNIPKYREVISALAPGNIKVSISTAYFDVNYEGPCNGFKKF